MRRTVLAALLAAGVAGVNIGAQSADEALPVFRSSVDLVPIRAIVRDHHGRIVQGLSATDFRVFDNGRVARIVDFQNDRASAVTIAVLVDTSGSMSMGPKVAFANEMLNQLGAWVRPDDEIGLFTFDSRLRQRRPFSSQEALMSSAIEKDTPWGTTSLYDAIGDAAGLLADRTSLRRAVVVLTDGLDNGSTRTAIEISGIASSLDVPVYVIATVSPMDRDQYQMKEEKEKLRARSDSATLSDLAAWTGGDFKWVSSHQDAFAVTRELISELRQQYVLAIESSPGPDWRPVEIKLRNDRFSVRARAGYFGKTPVLSR